MLSTSALAISRILYLGSGVSAGILYRSGSGCISVASAAYVGWRINGSWRQREERKWRLSAAACCILAASAAGWPQRIGSSQRSWHGSSIISVASGLQRPCISAYQHQRISIFNQPASANKLAKSSAGSIISVALSIHQRSYQRISCQHRQLAGPASETILAKAGVSYRWLISRNGGAGILALVALSLSV